MLNIEWEKYRQPINHLRNVIHHTIYRCTIPYPGLSSGKWFLSVCMRVHCAQYRLASVCAIAHLPPFPFRKQALLKDASFNSLTYEEISAHKVCPAEVRKAYSTEISPLQFKYYFFVKYVFKKYIPPSPQQYQVWWAQCVHFEIRAGPATKQTMSLALVAGGAGPGNSKLGMIFTPSLPLSSSSPTRSEPHWSISHSLKLIDKWLIYNPTNSPSSHDPFQTKRTTWRKSKLRW